MSYYTIAYDSTPCESCGLGAQYTVVDPKGVAVGVSYEDRDDAECLAMYMNMAYEQGCKDGTNGN